MPKMTVPTVALHDGVEIPQLGLGVFQLPPEEAQGVVEHALDLGYRHIDTAASRRGEAAVGAALAASGVPRGEVFVTAKMWNAGQGYGSTLEAFEATLDRFGFEYVDLCLVHWPVVSEGFFLDTWRASEQILEEGRASTIGVSGCRIEDLERLEVETDTRPTVHQVGPQLLLEEVELCGLHTEYRIATGVWDPLADDDLLADETIGALAARHGKSPAQAILRWHMQLGNIAVPTPGTAERIRENVEIFDFELSDEEMTTIGETDAAIATARESPQSVR